MKIRKILIVTLMSIGYNMMAQVGVYTKQPKVSMEIQKASDPTLPVNGFLLPRLTITELENDLSRYGADQNGALVFITDVSGGDSNISSTSDIKIPGLYFFDSANSKWKMISKNTSLVLDAVSTEAQDTDGNPIPGQTVTTYTLIYKDEVGVDNYINMNALIESAETITSLTYDGASHQLIYTDEKGFESKFDLIDLVGDSQTLTSLTLDIDEKRLIYVDEDEQVHSLDLAPIIQEPWYGVGTNVGAISNTQDVYTKGWVGIGYTSPSVNHQEINEKLRVNGSISAVNNYYADYVFEDYFEGFSEIKSDYEFRSLEEVEDFIKKNKHLPGITPIYKLEKTNEGYSFNISELSIQLLEKTEELYLHTIEQENKINEQSKQIEELQKALFRLEQLIK